ncbi:alpha/beta hydrolase [Nocardia sp. NPDC050799]|uniref:alpha/beta hydrolase n=1 Tax=Nocardia sp. NPDC050799 TaxID=3154842 RepID=UPI0033EDCC47
MNRKWRLRRGLPLLAVFCLTGALAGAPPVAAEEGGEPGTQLQWGPCPEDVPADPPQLQCATLPVPLNYSDPGGVQIELMISRLASTNPDKRRGVLLLNPGGPGGSGLGLSKLLVDQGAPDSVLDSYDLIGMDTRGVGHSSPVSCGFTIDRPYYTNIPPYAVDEAAVAAQAAVARDVAELCAANDPEGRLPHLTTANNARDLDRIRAALGEETASFLGYSYGSAVGAAYASMFPERADRVVLDSNIGDTFLDQDGMRRYGRGVEETFPDFAQWAAARHDSYGLGRTPEEVRATYFTIAEGLDKKPVDGIDGGFFRFGVFAALFNTKSYEKMAQTWQSQLAAVRAGSAGDPAATAPPADPTALVPHDNSLTVFLATTCNDVEWPEDIGAYERAVAEDREQYPLFGAATANILPCAYWKWGPVEPAVRIDNTGPADVLILQNQRDPVTPLRGGELLDEKFGERSRLVDVDGSGHGVYVLGKNSCAFDIATDYLVDGTMPGKDQTCEHVPAAG